MVLWSFWINTFQSGCYSSVVFFKWASCNWHGRIWVTHKQTEPEWEQIRGICCSMDSVVKDAPVTGVCIYCKYPFPPKKAMNLEADRPLWLCTGPVIHRQGPWLMKHVGWESFWTTDHKWPHLRLNQGVNGAAGDPIEHVSLEQQVCSGSCSSSD